MEENRKSIVLDRARDAILAGNPLDLQRLLADHQEIFQQQRDLLGAGGAAFDPLLLAAYHAEEACGVLLLQLGFASDRLYDGVSAEALAEQNGCRRLLRGVRLLRESGGGDLLRQLAAEAVAEYRKAKQASLHEQAKQAIYHNALSDKQGNTLLHICARRTDLQAIVTAHTLAVMGIFVNSQNKAGETALHVAAKANNLAMCRALLLSGLNPTLRDRLGQSAAEYATSPEVAALIGRHSPGLAESLLADNYRGVARSLQLWVSANSQLLPSSSAIDHCADAGAAAAASGRRAAIVDLVAREAPFLELLHNVLADNTEGAKALLRRVPPARIDRQHPDTGLTLVAAAVRNNNLPLVRALIAAGAPVTNVRVEGEPLAHHAISSGCSFDLLLELLEAGVDAAARDSDGFTMLHRLIRTNIGAGHFGRVLRANNGANALLLADRLPFSCECRSAREMAERLGRRDLAEAMDEVVDEMFAQGSRVAKDRLMRLATRFYGVESFGPPAEGDAVKQQFLLRVPLIERACSELFDAIAQNDMKAMKALNEADYQDVCGYTALIRAIAADRYEMVQWILAERPQQATIPDNEGLTPLHFAYLVADDANSARYVQLLTKAAPVPLPEAAMEVAADMRGFIPCGLRDRKRHSFFQQALRRAASLTVYGTERRD